MEIKKSILREVYKKRSKDVHKYDFGSLLIIGGSTRYSGSPALAALAAYRSGVDLVTIAAPSRAADIIAGFAPEMITYPLPGNYLSPDHLEKMLELTKSASAVVLGGGLERRKETRTVILEFLRSLELPAVIDADGIRAVAQQPDVIKYKPFILTPHANEFYALSGVHLGGLKQKDIIKAVSKIAEKLKTTILLKMHVDIIADAKRTAINRTGDPRMTVGGTGDTLAGILGALLARGCDPFIAACAAAFINGVAGELAAKKFGEGMLASDMLQEIPKVIGI